MLDDSDTIIVPRRDLAVVYEAAGAWLHDPLRDAGLLAALRERGIEDADIRLARASVAALLMESQAG